MCARPATRRVSARGRSVAALTAAAVLTLSPALFAQTLPLPSLPREPAAVDPADPGAADVGLVSTGGDGQERPRAWEYALGAGAAYETNIGFRAADGPSSWAILPRANLARLFRSRKGEMRLGADGYWIGYRDQRDLSTYNATLSLEASHRSSVRTTWRASGSYSLGYSDSSTVLTEQGVFLPLVKTRTLAGSVGVSQQLGSKTFLRLDGRIYRTEFDEAPSEPVGLADGQSIRGSAALGWTLGLRDTVALVYSLESALGRAATDAQSSYYRTHYGSLQWTRLLSLRSGLLLEAGGSHTPQAEAAGLGQQASFYGGASFDRQVKRSRLTLFARREVAPAFGLGFSRLENRFGLAATIPFGRAWTLQVNAIHVLPETPEGAEAVYSTPDEAFVSLGRRVGRSFEVSTEGRYRRRGSTTTFPAIESYRVGVFLSLLSPTARSLAPSSRR